LQRRTWLTLFWGAFAYFWVIINDYPVNADQLLGKGGYLLMEVILNSFSLLGFCLAAREVAMGRAVPRMAWRAWLWTALAFLTSADDISLSAHVLKLPKSDLSFFVNIAIHASSLVFFYMVVRESRGQAVKAEAILNPQSHGTVSLACACI